MAQLKKIDVDFVKANLNLQPETIKNILFTDASAVFTSASDSSLSVFAAHKLGTISKTALGVLNDMKELQAMLGICKQCLLYSSRIKNSIIISSRNQVECCKVEFCKDCHIRMLGNIYSSYGSCDKKGYKLKSLLQMRLCMCCIKSNTKCVKFCHLTWTCDGFSVQASALNMPEKENGSYFQDTDSLSLLLPVSKMVHMDKKLLKSVTNWWLILDRYRINVMMICTCAILLTKLYLIKFTH